MKTGIKLILIVAVLGGGFLLWKEYGSFLLPSMNQPAPVKAVEDSSSKIRYPVTTLSKASDASGDDKSVQQKAAVLFNKADFEAVIIFENFIQNFVITIENAEGAQIPVSKSPIKTAPGDPIVTRAGGHLVWSERNYKRYQSYMSLAEAADLKKIVGYYQHVYPLFQSAYQDLGVPGYFNDKLIAVIDNLLATPDVQGPVRLTHPSIRYEFEDPQFESLSAIQKILIRMGPDNSRILKSKFKELREMLSHLDKTS